MRNLIKEFQYEGNRCFYEANRLRIVFKRRVEQMREEGKRISKQELIEDVAEKIGASASSINHWLNGHNAPNEIEKVLDIAECLGASTSEILRMDCKEKKEENVGGSVMKEDTRDLMVRVVTEKVEHVNYSDERDVIRDIFSDMIDFIEEFRETIAFHYEIEVMDCEWNYVEAIDEASKKYLNIMKKIRKSVLDIPYEVYQNLKLFAEGYLNSCMGDDEVGAYIWDFGRLTDEELIANGFDVAALNPYSRRFDGYTTYCKRNGVEDDLKTRVEYVNEIADNAYVILDEILQPYYRK